MIRPALLDITHSFTKNNGLCICCEVYTVRSTHINLKIQHQWVLQIPITHSTLTWHTVFPLVLMGFCADCEKDSYRE